MIKVDRELTMTPLAAPIQSIPFLTISQVSTNYPK